MCDRFYEKHSRETRLLDVYTVQLYSDSNYLTCSKYCLDDDLRECFKCHLVLKLISRCKTVRLVLYCDIYTSCC